MSLYNKQHLGNIWGSIYQKVKQHWGWVEKKRGLYKKACIRLCKPQKKCGMKFSKTGLLAKVIFVKKVKRLQSAYKISWSF